MKHILVYIFLTMFPVLGWAQNTDNIPNPSNCNGCVVIREKKNGKIQKVRIGYDNHNKHEYLKITAEPGKTILAVERVVFDYDQAGLNIFAYIPQRKDRYLNRKVLKKFNLDMLQSTDTIELYRLDSLILIKNLVDSITKSKVGIAIIKRLNKSAMEIDAPEFLPLSYTYLHQTNPQNLRDHYRAHKRSKWYFEVGGLAGLSYRTLQVVNPLPKREIYETRLREDKAQFSWAGSLRGGYNITNSHSVYGGLIYLHQQFNSNGKIDWNSGLIGDTTVIDSKNCFDYWGTEIGYSYMHFRKKSAISVDVGMDFLLANNRNSIHRFTFGPHLAIGPKFRIGSGADMRIMPTFYYNLRSLEKQKPGGSQQELGTRMFTTGIKMSIRWN